MPSYHRFRNGFILICLLMTFFGSHHLSAQGRLLIVGGGSEKNGAASWSTPPYRWAVEGRRVAIIGTETGSLAPYMTAQCGAARAKEFAINSHDSANSQATYDTLLTYDVIFFRGGDQWEYYNLYRNTKLQDAVETLFSQGGCIGGTSAGMHILSSVVFTAENGTVYPYECLENPSNPYVTLEDDFLELQPGFVYDTHFAERARFARMVGFLANYKWNHNQDILGLGMDDLTCMTIDEYGLGTVYGTGCANFYRSGGSYGQNGDKLLADSVEVVQLLKGCTYDFNTGDINFQTLDRQINTSGQSETGNYTLLASGSNLIADNLAMLADLVAGTGIVTDSVLILSGDNSLALTFKNTITESGVAQAGIFNPTAAMGDDPLLASHINAATKILFLKNEQGSFAQFLATPNGTLLWNKLHSDGMISAFAGEDARFAGKTVVGNYMELYASWYGKMTFSPGLSLLKHTVVMPQTYLNSDIYENTATAVPYAMALDTLKYGIWLTNHSFMKYAPVGGKAILTGYGTAPVMVIANAGTLAGFSRQTATGSSVPPRMVAGFEKLTMDFIDYTSPYTMGEVQPSGNETPDLLQAIALFPNPVERTLSCNLGKEATGWTIFRADGRFIQDGAVKGKELSIDVSGFPAGIYLIRLSDDAGNAVAGSKFMKR